MALLATAVAAVVSGLSFSRYYWQYLLRPPGVLAELREVASLEQISWVGHLHPETLADLEVEPLAALPAKLVHWNTPFELFPTSRVIREFRSQGLEPTLSDPVELVRALEIWRAAEAAGLLIDGRTGYGHTKELRGYIGVIVTEDGERLVFASVLGNEHSNDHYPYYELVAHASEGSPVIRSSLWYFIDIAGIEGLTWWLLAVAIFVPLASISLVGAGIWHGVRAAQQSR